MSDLLLGMDYGTGGAKACIIDSQGKVLAYASEEYPFIHEHPGWSEHDAELYWKVASRLIHRALAASGVDPANIRGVAISSALPSMVMVDAAHRPIHRAYNLLDRRAVEQVQWLRDHVGEERIFQLTGNRIEDHPSIVNLMWERDNRPEAYKAVWKALTIDGFITLKLTGQATLNVSAAAFYGVAYNLRTLDFDHEMLDAVGISPDLLPPLFDCTDIVGEVTAKAAAQTGLRAGTPVLAGQVDCNAGYLGAGATQEGDIQCNLGTVGNLGLVFKDVEFCFSTIGHLMINFPYTTDSRHTYISVPTTMTGGQSIRYLRDELGQYEVEVERVLGTSSYDLLNLQARKVPLGSDGLIILPFLMGERSPIWDVYARGVIFGLSMNHTKGHLVRAMMEAVAYAMYDSFQLLRQAGLKINLPLVMNEGGAVSALWRQIITDVFDVPIVLAKQRAGAPFGDALLAGVATGVFNSFDVARQWAEYVEPMEPTPEHHARYIQYYTLYKRVYEHLADDFLELAKLRGQIVKDR